MGDGSRLPLIVKIQVLIAVVALGVTVAATFQLPSLIQTKQTLQAEINGLEEKRRALEERQREAEAALRQVVARVNADKSATASVRPRASATELKGAQDSRGRRVYDFRLWVDAPPALKDQVQRVRYQFDHPTFINKFQESTEPSNGFAVSYRGWGCLYLVTITLFFKDGRSEQVLFDMCNALG